MTPVETKRKLVLVVGQDSKRRTEVARDLIAEGSAVVLCPGPPACPLLRDESCVLVENADETMIIPATSRLPEVVSGLRLCAEASAHMVQARAGG